MRRFSFLTLVLGLIGLAACESTQEQLGLTQEAPDEFQVVRRAPLTLPPDYTLRPPRPGAPRPQEQAIAQQAASAIFGETANNVSAAPTDGESALLSRAGGQAADPDIRRKVDSETVALFDRNKPVAEKLLGIGGDNSEASATVVDAKAEAERLQENAEAGKPVTDGETPSIEE